MERDFKGIWIPKEIWLSKELTLQEKVFLVEIDSLDNHEGCYASNEYFANFFNLSKNRCTEIIKSLEKKGYINISYTYKPNTKSIDKRILKVVDNSNIGIRKTVSGYSENRRGCSENCEDNNTYNNINNNIYSDSEESRKIISKDDKPSNPKDASKNKEYLEFESIIKIKYLGKKVKSVRDKKVPKLLKTYSKEELERCIDRYMKECTSKDKQYILNESTFWNTRYIDYLDENYEDVKPVRKIGDRSMF